MLFNSTVFLEFFAAFLLLYFLWRKSLAARNLLILAASCLFYGWWDWRFLGLLLFSGCFDFGSGLLIGGTANLRRRKVLLCLSLAVNLSLLGVFKYFDFFLGSLAALLSPLHLNLGTLGLILPIGISFYTFQSLSYVIDVYRGQMEPTRSLVRYLAYVSFFPQLVAGPIERARDLLPQFQRTLVIDNEMIVQGAWLIVWGLFKKVVVADNLAPVVEMAFDNPSVTGPAVLCGALAFAFQIYGDFSGYSDIARGLARVLGFKLSVNFNLPYIATNLRDFWRRWHISLSSWLRDYLYISLGGNRNGDARTYLNVLLTMLIGGLWHGAAWNFVLWGAWHGAGLVANRWWQQRFGRLPNWISWPLTFLFVLYGWILFRAGSLQHVVKLTCAIPSWDAPVWLGNCLVNLAVLVGPLVAIEFWQKRANDQLVAVAARPCLLGFLQGGLLLAVVLFWEKKAVPFIYFQF